MYDIASHPLTKLLFPPFCFGCQTAVTGEILCHRCRSTLEFLSPPWCIRCGRPIKGSNRLCVTCKNKPREYENIISALSYRGPLVKLLALFKYSHYDFLSSFFVSLIQEHLEGIGFCADRYDMIIPVPLHRTKQRQREYNQSALLAQKLSEKMHIPRENDILYCRRHHPSQTKMDRKAREKNVENTFASRRVLNGNSVLLIDDVVTTGATASACSKALKENGAGRVSVLTLARAQ